MRLGVQSAQLLRIFMYRSCAVCCCAAYADVQWLHLAECAGAIPARLFVFHNCPLIHTFEFEHYSSMCAVVEPSAIWGIAQRVVLGLRDPALSMRRLSLMKAFR